MGTAPQTPLLPPERGFSELVFRGPGLTCSGCTSLLGGGGGGVGDSLSFAQFLGGWGPPEGAPGSGREARARSWWTRAVGTRSAVVASSRGFGSGQPTPRENRASSLRLRAPAPPFPAAATRSRALSAGRSAQGPRTGRNGPHCPLGRGSFFVILRVRRPPHSRSLSAQWPGPSPEGWAGRPGCCCESSLGCRGSWRLAFPPLMCKYLSDRSCVLWNCVLT